VKKVINAAATSGASSTSQATLLSIKEVKI
jgi:hypothetical protein